jgi:hypothetical protein
MAPTIAFCAQEFVPPGFCFLPDNDRQRTLPCESISGLLLNTACRSRLFHPATRDPIMNEDMNGDSLQSAVQYRSR